MANATTRAKRLNETKMILRQPLLLIAIILSFALLLLFVIYPLAKTLIYSLTDETGAFSLANLITILQTPRYGKVFGRTMALGLIVAVIATFIGYVFAYTVTRYRPRAFSRPWPRCPSSPRPSCCPCPLSSSSASRV